ncbi:MAG: tyrosine-protein phosphatase [Nanoarchaeota archaeon]
MRNDGIRPAVRLFRRKVMRPMRIFSTPAAAIIHLRDASLHPRVMPRRISEDFYRCGQIDCDELEELVKTKGIKAVVNLRGEKEGRHWYDEEIELCKDLGVKHFDVKMSSMEPWREAIIKYLEIINDRQNYPLDVHCTGHKDRSGLASAIYRVEILGHKTRDAMRELNPQPHKESMFYRFMSDYELFGEGRNKKFSEWTEEWDGKGYEQEKAKLLLA